MTTAPQRRANTTLAFHASRIVIDVGVLLVMAAMSLPFVETATGNRSSVAADALPALILVLPIFAITLIPDHTRPIPRPLAWASLVLGLAAFPYAVVKFLDAGVLADTLDGSVGMGARLLVFGTFVVLAGIAIGLTRLAMNLPSGGTPGARTTRPQPAPAQQQVGRPAPQQSSPSPAPPPASSRQQPPGQEAARQQPASQQQHEPQGAPQQARRQPQQQQQQRPQPSPEQLRRRRSEQPSPDPTQVMPRVHPEDSAPERGPSEDA